ncbi:MAG: efflux RND transporter periplasmic adaptor subunit, partial [Gemmatimonadaceae bacterium]
MDVARAPKKKTGRNIGIAVGIVAAVVATYALSKLKPAAPTIDGATILTDSVRQGELTRDVRGPGTLVPEQIRWITAQSTARVERLVAQAGQTVAKGELLIEMSSPDLQILTMQAEQQVREAQITLLNLKTTLRSSELSQEGIVASTKTAYIKAKQQAEAADTLLPKAMITKMDAINQKADAEELTIRYRIEQDRLKLMKQAIDSQIETQAAGVKQLRAIADERQSRLASLNVRSPEAGVLQDLTLQAGQYVQDGIVLAKVVQPGNLKAVLRIPESLAKDVQLGQIASVDTRNGLVAGTVSRKDAAASGGTVTIDVKLIGTLPAGAVPDLSVDGTIQIEKLKNVLYTGRPAAGSGTGAVGLFKLTEDGKEAVRVPVVLGASSVNAVVITSGLKVGDKVILS